MNFRANVWEEDSIVDSEYSVEDMEDLVKGVENCDIYLNSNCTEVDDIIGVVNTTKYVSGEGIVVFGEIVDRDVFDLMEKALLKVAPRVVVQNRNGEKVVDEITCLFATPNPSSDVGELEIVED